MVFKRASGFPVESLGAIPDWADMFDGNGPQFAETIESNKHNLSIWFYDRVLNVLKNGNLLGRKRIYLRCSNMFSHAIFCLMHFLNCIYEDDSINMVDTCECELCVHLYVLAVKIRMPNKWWGEQCCRYATVN